MLKSGGRTAQPTVNTLLAERRGTVLPDPHPVVTVGANAVQSLNMYLPRGLQSQRCGVYRDGDNDAAEHVSQEGDEDCKNP